MMTSDSVTLYVSPCGNDAWSGRVPEPSDDGTDGPLATPAGAQRRARETGITYIAFRDGCYCLPETWTFTPADNGTAAAPVIYGAYPGESPVISGGRVIDGWKPGTIHGQPCWTVHLPEVAAGAWYFTQLFVNGARRPRPCLPKTGYTRFTGVPEGGWEGQWGKGPRAAFFAPGEIADWTNLADVELTVLQLWFETHHHLAAVDEAQHLATFYNRSIGSLQDEQGQYARYRVENVFEALSEPGEWYLDRPTGTLYYLPRPGETPETTTIIAPRLACLLRVEAAHLCFENLTFRHAEWRLAIDDTGAAQAAVTVPGAVIMQGAEACVLYGCTVEQVSGYAVEVLHPSHDVQIVACALRDLGAGGVKIGHEGLGSRLEGEAAMARVTEAPGMRVTVRDCRIHDGGLIYPSAIGVWVGNSGRNRIRHNEIFNLNYSGISCGWTWGYAPTLTIDNRIEYNHIHHCGQGLLSDLGGIYTLGTQPGTIIRGNHIHDITKYGYGGWGIYTDEGSSEMRIEGNIVYRTGEQGFFQHYGKDNLVCDNIFADCDGLGRGREEPHCSFVIARNLILARDGFGTKGTWANGHFRLLGNLYWHTDDTPLLFGSLPFDEWQAWGHDLDSIITDPLFHDPESGTFTLREDSPALALGFRPLYPLPAGPRYPDIRPTHFHELPAETLPPARIIRTRLEVETAPIPGVQAGTIRLTAINAGEEAVAGALTLAVASGAVLQGDRRLAFALAPGETATLSCAIDMPGDIAEAVVFTRPETDAAVPTALYLPFTRPWRAAGRRDELDTAEPRQARFGPRVLATVRLARDGQALVVRAEVNDAHPTQRPDAPWEGSCIELFGAMPTEDAIGQVFLLPAAVDAPAQALCASADGPRPAPDIELRMLPAATGYTLEARIPPALLALAPDAESFRLEVAVSIRDADGRARRVTLFGSTQAYASTERYGNVVVG